MSLTPSIQLMTEATVAQYIHEISARHQKSDSRPDLRRTLRPRAGGAQPVTPSSTLKRRQAA